MVKKAAALDGPVFLRISRMPVPALDRARPECRIGHAEVLREGGDIALIANGTLVHRALAAAEALAAEGIEARVLNFSTVAPFDQEAVAVAAATGAIVTAEEHVVRGGLGGAVAEFVATHDPVPMRILGFPGFLPTGSAEWLMERHGLTADGIATAARELMRRKRG
jgi:transketolase